MLLFSPNTGVDVSNPADVSSIIPCTPIGLEVTPVAPSAWPKTPSPV